MRAVRRLRLLLNISLVDMSAESGVCDRELKRIEKGDARPKAETMKAIDDAFDRNLNRRNNQAAIPEAAETGT